MDGNVRQDVTCYSGYTYAQRPTAFSWQGQHLNISEIIAEWHIPSGHRFFARTEEDLIFELVYHEGNLDWQVNPVR